MAFRGGDYYLEFVYVDRFAGYSCGYGGEPERTAFGFVPQVLAGSLDGGGQAYGHLVTRNGLETFMTCLMASYLLVSHGLDRLV